MDLQKTGLLIRGLRLDNNMTQLQLANKLCVSDKAVSKWERGMGLPDISVLQQLANIFNVGVSQILSGELNIDERQAGNLKKIKFYVCEKCGGIYTSTGNGEINCCGHLLNELKAKPYDKPHNVTVENVEDELYITFDHEMTKQHYISFLATADCDKVTIYKLYPEQNPSLRISKCKNAQVYFYCNRDGLFSL